MALAPAWVRSRAVSIYLLAFFGFIPVSALIFGSIGNRIGAAPALVLGSIVVVALSVVVLYRPLIDVGGISSRASVGTRPAEDHPDIYSDSSIMVSTTWAVRPGRLDEFVEVMDEMRRIRLQTGAFRWTLYREVIQPLRFTEVYEIDTWEQHLRQHERLDARALEVIARAITFDVDEGPKSVHLVAVDAESLWNASWWSVDAEEHDELHRSDGSIPTIPLTGSPATQHIDSRTVDLA